MRKAILLLVLAALALTACNYKTPDTTGKTGTARNYIYLEPDTTTRK